jgi:hypothetical protein
MKKYWHITDAAPPEVEAKTGLRGVPTPQGGTLVEAREPPSIDALMERLDRALHPRQCSCTIVHMPPCRFAYMTT